MSDELTAALRQLAARHETPPLVTASEVRARATRRSRRRRATAVVGLATVAGTLAVITLTPPGDDPDNDRQVPATASDTPTPTATTPRPALTPPGVLDLGRHTLTVGARVMRVDTHSFGAMPPGGELTVTVKHQVLVLPEAAEAAKDPYGMKIPYVVELRADDRSPVYAGALGSDTKALAALAPATDWIGLTERDAEWLYSRTRKGDRVRVTSTVPPGTWDAGTPVTPTPTTLPARTVAPDRAVTGDPG
ncbi:hypothetical protein ACFYOV_04375 [Streptomyces sp. NPDC005931]|uniref:hypothetical protein n=1 Tax=Streptomyces sp. NPDC005931 TaxID=3364737 RepID=UPI00368AFA27